MKTLLVLKSSSNSSFLYVPDSSSAVHSSQESFQPHYNSSPLYSQDITPLCTPSSTSPSPHKDTSPSHFAKALSPPVLHSAIQNPPHPNAKTTTYVFVCDESSDFSLFYKDKLENSPFHQSTLLRKNPRKRLDHQILRLMDIMNITIYIISKCISISVNQYVRTFFPSL